MNLFGIIFHPVRVREELLTLRRQTSEHDKHVASLEAQKADLSRHVREERERYALLEETTGREVERLKEELAAKERELKMAGRRIDKLSQRIKERDKQLAEQEEQMATIGSQAEKLIEIHRRYEKRIELLRSRLEKAKRTIAVPPAEDGITSVRPPRRGFYTSREDAEDSPSRETNRPRPVSATPADKPEPQAPADESWYIPLPE